MQSSTVEARQGISALGMNGRAGFLFTEKWKCIAAEIFHAYAILLFSKDLRVGVMLFCLSFVNSSSGIHAVCVYFAVRAFTRLAGFTQKELANPFLLYNPLLVGLSIGYLYAPSPISVLLAVAGGVFCLVLCQGLQSVLGHYFALPILNLPFSIIATFIYLAGARYGSLYLAHPALPAYLNSDRIPYWLSGLFHSLGILVFLPSDAAGILLLAMFWFVSRIQFFLIILSYYAGTLFHGLLYADAYQAFLDPYNYNFISVGLAMGGYFLIPSRRTYLIVMLTVAAASLLQDALGVFWSGHQVPVFTFPFAIATLLFLYVLKIKGYSHVTWVFFRTPEENLENWICNTQRFGAPIASPYLPFLGEWTVYQGFDDKWTHQGNWKHALDFVIQDPVTEMTFRNEGRELADYLCFGKPVISPVAGWVVAVEAGFPDNPIGTVDSEKNWGNYVVVQSGFGYYVELSHLKNNGVAVEEGQWVAMGQLLGYCGNSGYSPQPHLHMQCQYQAFAGAPTVPFALSSAVAGHKLLGPKEVPVTDDVVRTLPHSTRWCARMNYVLDEKFIYSCTLDGQTHSQLVIQARMDLWGVQYLEDLQSHARLYFTVIEGRFTFLRFEGRSNSWLRFFFIAMPSLPPTADAVTWEDVLPGTILRSRSRLTPFLQSFDHRWLSARGAWNLLDDGRVHGDIQVKTMRRLRQDKTELWFSEHRSPEKLVVHTSGKRYEMRVQRV